MRRKFVGAGLVCVALVATLAGCRTSGNDKTVDVGVGGSTVIVAKESPTPHFEPNVIKVAPGAEVVLTLKNEGTVAHNFTVSYLDISVSAEPGQSVPVKFTAPKSGTLLFKDRNYMGDGMTGKIEVTTKS